MGRCELWFEGGLHGKKTPNRRFFGILCAKRNKLVGGINELNLIFMGI
jgi:hypothetical protein